MICPSTVKTTLVSLVPCAARPLFSFVPMSVVCVILAWDCSQPRQQCRPQSSLTVFRLFTILFCFICALTSLDLSQLCPPSQLMCWPGFDCSSCSECTPSPSADRCMATISLSNSFLSFTLLTWLIIIYSSIRSSLFVTSLACPPRVHSSYLTSHPFHPSFPSGLIPVVNSAEHFCSALCPSLCPHDSVQVVHAIQLCCAAQVFCPSVLSLA